ncbi:MarR family transcriptional regulator [Flavobacterium album]|uniref:MarR family transcriptional regulator n=1 Tax=Flavobacterium album TaxID=2175091 RepID=A0A2S1QYR9_9FLAO|nr:MarR family transcriptional regulator [Flavobacterium album]AWH85563.1 MarR family transcriptional regulator [Flavobacterium album]
MENLNSIIFYTIDKSIKSYRQFAQKRLKEAGFTITIDQWLVLKAIEQDSLASQQQIAAAVFKDVASITRMIELLVQKGYLSRELHSADRRRFKITLTEKGEDVIEKMQPYVNANRKQALQGISEGDIKIVQEVLSKITENVT